MRNLFNDMHEVARHGMHVTEVLDVCIETFLAIQRYQDATFKLMNTALEAPYVLEAKEYLQFQLQTLKSLKLRSQSNEKRIQNEITLVRGILITCFVPGNKKRY